MFLNNFLFRFLIKIMNKKTQSIKNSHKFCGVPQCKTYKSPDISLHRIPKAVFEDKDELVKWKIALKMKKPFTKTFLICSRHFNEKYILIPFFRGQQIKARLSQKAFPTENLPKTPTKENNFIDKFKEQCKMLEKQNLKKNCLQNNLSEGDFEFVEVEIEENSVTENSIEHI